MSSISDEFQKRFKTLPEDLQNALTAVATVDTLTAIGKKNGLMIDQIGKLADEIWKVMLGLADPKDFIRNLAAALKIDAPGASIIAQEVNTQIFQPVRESLRKLYDTTEQKSVPPISTKEGEVASSTYQVLRNDKKELKPHDTSYMIHDTKQAVPPMIYPQERFQEEFKKEPSEQLALPPSPPVQSLSQDDFTYPEKTKEVHREEVKGRSGYQGSDPYREAIE